MGYIDYFGDDDDQVDIDQLLKEFEKHIESSDPWHDDSCDHVWELVGRSPVLDEKWYNCKKCGIKKEDYMRKRLEKYDRKK